MANLMQIPGLAGILQARQLNQQAGQQELQQAQGLIGILSAVQAQQQRAQAFQEQQEIKGLLSRVSQQAGGDPAKMVPLLLQTGTPVGIKLAEGMKGLLPKPAEGFTLGPDQTRFDADGNPVAWGTPKEKEPKAPPSRRIPVQVGKDYFEVTQEMLPNGQWNEVGRRPLRDPTIVMPKNPPAPIATDQGFFERGPNGSLVPMMDPNRPDRQLRPPSLVSGGNQQALALRRSYDSNPEVRLANSLEPRVGPMAQYYKEVGKGMGNSVGDAELVKLWLMTTHPKGDQISNLDYRTIEKMPDLWGRVKNVAGNFVFGKTLDADTRAKMWESISSKFKATAESRNKVRQDVIGRGRNMGIDESLIFAPQQE